MIGKLVRIAGAVAATAAASAVNPALGAALGSSFVGAGAMKVAGKKIEERGGPPVHRIASPVAALSLPVLLQSFGVDLRALCDVVQRLCSDDALPVAVGATAVVLHQVLRGVTSAFARQ